MKKPKLLRVRATGAHHPCTGCVYSTRLGACSNDIDGESCVEAVDGKNEDYIFIHDNEKARIAYVALILEHGRQT